MNNQKLLPIKHASAGDWDFTYAEWSIETAHYVSSPSSLRWQRSAGYRTEFALCKATGTHKLPEGRVVNNFRQSNDGYELDFYLRNTSPIGSANNNNGYYVWFRPNSAYWYLRERQAGVQQRQWYTTCETWVPPLWRRYRLSWWLSWGILMVRLEREQDDEWIQEGDDLSVSDPLFGEEDIQRCGVGCKYGSPTYPCYIDDTEIWEYP